MKECLGIVIGFTVTLILKNVKFSKHLGFCMECSEKCTNYPGFCQCHQIILVKSSLIAESVSSEPGIFSSLYS
jgi:hypothetical protein